MVNVSFKDAQAYAAWLAQKTGKPYRLPTEAEWEYAARAGTGTSRYWGNNANDACAYANVYDRTGKAALKYPWEAHDCEDGYVYTAPIGQFKPNTFGVHDMLGNVWEWTCSRYANPYDGAESRCDDSGAYRVVRGGSWFNNARFVRSAFRSRNGPDNRDQNAGFRLALGQTGSGQ